MPTGDDAEFWAAAEDVDTAWRPNMACYNTQDPQEFRYEDRHGHRLPPDDQRPSHAPR